MIGWAEVLSVVGPEQNIARSQVQSHKTLDT